MSSEDVPVVENDDDSSGAAAITYTRDQQGPEYMQRKLYFLLEQLKLMHQELPE